MWGGTGVDPGGGVGLETPEKHTPFTSLDTSGCRVELLPRRRAPPCERVCVTCSRGWRGADWWRGLNAAFLHHVPGFSSTLAPLQAETQQKGGEKCTSIYKTIPSLSTQESLERCLCRGEGSTSVGWECQRAQFCRQKPEFACLDTSAAPLYLLASAAPT